MNRDIFKLDNKVALITGASRGIGEAIAKTLAENGAQVILTSRKIDALQEVEKEITANGGKATSIACHTGNMEQINNLFEEIKKRFGRLDILINNAATNPFFGDVLSIDEKAWDKTVEVNFKGYFFMSQGAAKIMKEKDGGAIVNIASVNGVRPAPGQGVYSMTKAAVINMTQAFAKELAEYNIRVNAILPGLTDTKFAAVLMERRGAERTKTGNTLKRAAQPEEMAGAALYLVSDAATYTTGTCITVDGGSLA
ncbi:MAG: SDR family oxidoreductase [Deltaproteobacteria bacterium]|nr:SDR family oxidoreductase [Deltaproteobacteria bacterium]